MASLGNKVLVIRSEGMGEGDPVLGATILASLLRLTMQAEERPRAIFCYNAGVKLLAEGSPVAGHLQELMEMGVKVQACKTCVEFFHLGGKLLVGEVSTMAQYVEYLESSEVVVL